MVQTMEEEVWHCQEGAWHEIEGPLEESEVACTRFSWQYLPLGRFVGIMSPWYADAVYELGPETSLVECFWLASLPGAEGQEIANGIVQWSALKWSKRYCIRRWPSW